MVFDEAKPKQEDERVETWAVGVKRLVGFAIAFPQKACASLMMLIQKEWQFFKSVTPGVGTLFETLEAELRDDFLLDLLGGMI